MKHLSDCIPELANGIDPALDVLSPFRRNPLNDLLAVVHAGQLPDWTPLSLLA
jgi:hypothetical protein